MAVTKIHPIKSTLKKALDYIENVFENREHLRRRNCIAQCFHPLAAVRHLFGQARDVGGFFGPKGMSVHLRGKPISHSTQSGLR